MSDYIKRLTANNEALKKMQEERKEIINAHLKDALVDLINQHPIVSQVRWVQFTPGFNDGDPCTFSKHENEIDYLVDGVTYRDADDVEEEDNLKSAGDFIKKYDAKWNLVWLNKDAQRAHEEINGFLDLFCDGDFEELFGDGVEVIANKDGVEINDYYHD